jgi:hypothetical protein
MKTFSVRQIIEFEWVVEAETEQEAINKVDGLAYEDADNMDALVYGVSNSIYKTTELENDLGVA